MDCDNTIKLNPDVINPEQKKDPRVQKVENLVILYHELLHGQLMLDAISSSEEWQKDVCNKTPSDKIDYSYSDKEHVIINPLQEDLTSKLIENEGGLFFIKEIIPEDTTNGIFSTKVTNRNDHPEIFNKGIKVTYRGINMENPSVTFPDDNIIISGNLKETTTPATAWVYVFSDNSIPSIPTQQIPEWIKNNARWWSEGTITDSDFFKGIEYLIQNNIMTIQANNQNSNPSQEIPSWIKNNAQWWSSGLISDDDFVVGIKYLIEAGIISYQ